MPKRKDYVRVEYTPTSQRVPMDLPAGMKASSYLKGKPYPAPPRAPEPTGLPNPLNKAD